MTSCFKFKLLYFSVLRIISFKVASVQANTIPMFDEQTHFASIPDAFPLFIADRSEVVLNAFSAGKNFHFRKSFEIENNDGISFRIGYNKIFHSKLAKIWSYKRNKKAWALGTKYMIVEVFENQKLWP